MTLPVLVHSFLYSRGLNFAFQFQNQLSIITVLLELQVIQFVLEIVDKFVFSGQFCDRCIVVLEQVLLPINTDPFVLCFDCCLDYVLC